ncbi:hypothetical protein TrVGV298_008883 [Trichoderma virens]|nr:hypothetical protein TrVGV298_008883 [Trichoderma virens]
MLISFKKRLTANTEAVKHQDNLDTGQTNPDTDPLFRISTSHEKLAAKLFSCVNETGLCIFQDYNGRSDGILTSPGYRNSTIFHEILYHRHSVIDNKLEGGNHPIHTFPTVVQEFLEYLIIDHHVLLTQPNSYGYRPLDELHVGVIPMLFTVLEFVLSDDVLCKLSAEACPMTWNKSRAAGACNINLPERIRSVFAKDFSGSDGAALASGGCVHDTVRVDELLKWNAQLKETVRLIELCPKETLESVNDKGNTPLHEAVLLYEKEDLDFGRLHDVICSLVQHCPSSIYSVTEGVNDTAKQTAYSMLQALDPQRQSAPGQKSADPDKMASLYKTMTLLKHTCIGGDRDRDEKLVYLYGGLKNARNIYLDVTDVRIIDKNFIINLSDRVKFNFDTALEYVSLRRDLTGADYISPEARDINTQERNHYQGVFRLLRTKWSVRKIFHVIVDDLVPFPHTDKAIKAALKPFNIERWDWRKLDICGKTILDAAPGTRELYLQSSGNEAILRSWACKYDGLQKLNQLKFITIVMHADLRETKRECQRLFNRFKRDFCRWRPDMRNSIYLQWAAGLTGQDDGAEDAGSSFGYNQSDQIAWIRTMQPFINFLQGPIKSEIERKMKQDEQRNQDEQSDEDEHSDEESDEDDHIDEDEHIDENRQSVEEKKSSSQDEKEEADARIWRAEKKMECPAYVSIALIDNGVYSAAEDIPIMMAQCIYKVCPMARLYVARMDDSMPTEKLTVDSAIKAIEWATNMGVDIISMSWTFHERGATAAQTEAFKRAIQNASSKNIILLSSLNDMEMTMLEEWYPIRLYEVIRVGSATKWGEKTESGNNRRSNYLFPAKDISLPAPDGSGDEAELISGSSVATAFAAGLAGLIIYAGRALSYLSPDDHQRLAIADTRDKIMRAFNVLSGRPHESLPTDLFVGLGAHFPKDPERDADENGRVQVLSSFLNGFQLRD